MHPLVHCLRLLFIHLFHGVLDSVGDYFIFIVVVIDIDVVVLQLTFAFQPTCFAGTVGLSLGQNPNAVSVSIVF